MSQLRQLLLSRVSAKAIASSQNRLCRLQRGLCSATMSEKSEKHLRKGEPLPAYEPGTLRLFSMRFCPYVQRTRLVLAHKRIPHDTVNINLRHKPAWLFERNPVGLVPVLEKDGQIIYESTVTSDWLDDVYPGDKLTPDDPHERARQKMLYESFYKVTDALYRGVLSPEGEEEKVKLYRRLERYESSLTGDYFGGDKVMMVDFMLWPWFERLDVFTKVGLLELPEARYPRLRAWITRMLELPAVQQILISPSLHMKWFKAYGAQDYQYDFDEDEEDKQPVSRL